MTNYFEITRGVRQGCPLSPSLLLCLVLVEPKAPCYRAHVCVRNSGFSRILRQQPETTFEQCSFDFRIPRRHDVDGNQQPETRETTFEQCSFDFRIPRRHDVMRTFCYDRSMCSHCAFVQRRW